MFLLLQDNVAIAVELLILPYYLLFFVVVTYIHTYIRNSVHLLPDANGYLITRQTKRDNNIVII